MEQLFALLLPLLPFLSDTNVDPAASFWEGRRALRAFTCTRLSQAEAHERFPVQVPEPPPRFGTVLDQDALVCERPFAAPGERGARDALILSDLQADVDEIVASARALGSERTRWYVDAFYPSPRVGVRIAAAARTSLAERGARVSNRVPLLAAGDLLVLRELDVARAYVVACQRYFAEGALEEGDAFLAVGVVDPRESELHAGVCLNGSWRWLR